MGTAAHHRNFLLQIQLLRHQVASFDVHPFNVPSIADMDTIRFDKPVTFFVGENGSGKSTLIEAIGILLGFNPEGGGRNFIVSNVRAHADMQGCLRPTRSSGRMGDGFFLRAESYFNLATEIDKLDEGPGGAPIKEAYGGKSLHHQSHGESFYALLEHRLRGDGLYILDEPEAALSPTRQMTMLTRLHQLVQDGSQFLIATHSPILMAYPRCRHLHDGKRAAVSDRLQGNGALPDHPAISDQDGRHAARAAGSGRVAAPHASGVASPRRWRNPLLSRPAGAVWLGHV